jgi:hypothetical protein
MTSCRELRGSARYAGSKAALLRWCCGCQAGGLRLEQSEWWSEAARMTPLSGGARRVTVGTEEGEMGPTQHQGAAARRGSGAQAQRQAGRRASVSPFAAAARRGGRLSVCRRAAPPRCKRLSTREQQRGVHTAQPLCCRTTHWARVPPRQGRCCGGSRLAVAPCPAPVRTLSLGATRVAAAECSSASLHIVASSQDVSSQHLLVLAAADAVLHPERSASPRVA